METPRKEAGSGPRMLLAIGLTVVAIAVVVALGRWLFGGPSAEPLAALEIAAESEAVVLGGPDIRVAVTPKSVESLTIRINGPYAVHPVGDGMAIAAGKELAEITVRTSPHGLLAGREEWPVTRVEIEPGEGATIWINKSRYRGRVRLFRQPENKVLAVNVLPLEAYLASVIDSEMPASFPEAAREAQAVVARTYALSRMERAPAEALFDVYASERSQKYLGLEYTDGNGRRLAGESADSRRIAHETSGVVLTSGGRVFTAYYSAVCGGRTVTGTEIFPDAASPHRSVMCESCRDAERYRWLKRITVSQLLESVTKATGGQKLTRITKIHAVTEPGDGQLTRFEFTDGRRTLRTNGVDLRAALPTGTASSPNFSLQLEGAEVTIVGRGHGHGVGLCQWGARGQGLAGKSSSEILRYYYPGAGIIRLHYGQDIARR